MKRNLGLGIETSCDESSLALFNIDTGIFVYEKTLTQIQAHAKYGGVVPNIASKLHLSLVSQILDEMRLEIPDWTSHIQWVAATTRPGLITSLLVGGVLGRSLAAFLQVPFIPIDHCEAHMYSPLIQEGGATQIDWEDIKKETPLVALIVSGGHSYWIKLSEDLEAKCIGTTRDDAVGECYDKVARMLGLGYPGGPIVEKLSLEGNAQAISLPLPMPQGIDFSLSGLKTAVKRQVDQQTTPLSKTFQTNMCAAFQKCIEDLIAKKTETCIQEHRPKSLWFSGGVSANQRLCRTVASVCTRNQVVFKGVPRKYAGDNASMIAYLGHLKYKLNPEIKPQDVGIVPYSVFSKS
jgi:N6-L-threonylcarbamoyladenine synthase